MLKIRIAEFFIPKLKYATTALVATGADYLAFFLMVNAGLHVTLSQFLANALGLIINFFMLQIFVFRLRRHVFTSFQLVILFAVIGLGLSTSLVHVLHQIPFFDENLLLMKILVTGIIFLYNFYTKRFAFEGKQELKVMAEEEAVTKSAVEH